MLEGSTTITNINNVVIIYRKNQLVSKNIINIAGTPVNTFITVADSTAPVINSIVNYVEESTVYGVPFGESYNTVSEYVRLLTNKQTNGCQTFNEIFCKIIVHTHDIVSCNCAVFLQKGENLV